MSRKIFFQKFVSENKTKIFKFLIIFSLTGSSSLFVSDYFILFLGKNFSLNLGTYYQIFFIIVFYHFILAFFCYIFGEFSYVLTKLRRLKQLFYRV